ncbi:MAG: cell envelope integrity protein TolA [Gammaproteobacteria bacterium]
MFDLPSVLMSVVLHGLLITVLVLWSGQTREQAPIEYQFLNANLVVQQVQPLAEKTQAAPQKAVAPLSPPEKASQGSVPKPKPKAEAPKPSSKPKPKPKQAALPQLDLPLESEWSSVLERDQEALADYDRALSVEAEAEQQALETRAYYVELIRNRVARYWSRPLSARNGMMVRLSVTVLPDGTVHRVEIKESSGQPAFDRSALQAVQRATTLPVPEERDVFNRYFRNFVLQFRPEDLQQ